MRHLILASLFLTLTQFAVSAPKVGKVVGLARNNVLKILGRPSATKLNKHRGVIDSYNLAGFKFVKISYIGEEPKLRQFDVRLIIVGQKPMSAALAAAGLNIAGGAFQRSTVDGSMLIKNIRGLPAGWVISYWIQRDNGGETNLDIESPEMMKR